MAAIQNLSLLDGQLPPVSRVFPPAMTSLTEARWADRSNGRLIGNPTIILKNRMPERDSPYFKVMGEIQLPVLETITNANASGYAAPPQVAYMVKGMFTFILPSRCALRERQDIAAYMSNALRDPQILSLITNFDVPF